ncbi:hypothetical protein EBO33_18565 [[Curtobacterium] plantarum]|nr:hypothetical protein EBO33_18565 [[Curtobacterium] plantarum]
MRINRSAWQKRSAEDWQRILVFTDRTKLKAMGAQACSKTLRPPDKNAGSVFEQRNALARLLAPLRDEVRTKNAGSVFEQRNALARLRVPLRDEVRTKNAGSVFEQRNALARLRAPLRDEVRNRPR